MEEITKRYFRAVILLAIIILSVSCSQNRYIITGNIEAEISMAKTGDLAQILSEAGIRAEYVLIIASDGIAVLLSEQSLPFLEIYSDKGVFNTRSDLLPPVTGLYNLREICVYISGFPANNYQTPFSARVQSLEFLGESSVAGHFVRKYRHREVVDGE